MEVEQQTQEVGEDGRARVRAGYRRLMDNIAGEEEDLGSLEQGGQLLGFMEENEQLFEQVAAPQEAVMDARVLKQLSRLCRKQAEQMSSNIAQFRPEEYAEKLITSMTGGGAVTRRKWVLLGTQTKAMFRRSPCLSYMYGALDTTPPPPKEKKAKEVGASQRTRVKDLVETRSTVLQEAEQSDNQTEQVVRHVLKCLVGGFRESDRQPINFFSFVLDPYSFGASVENLFHVSFLIKEGRVKLDVDRESGLPVISPLSTKSRQGEGGEKAAKQQVVLNICMSDWEQMVSNLNITTAMITRGDEIDQAMEPSQVEGDRKKIRL